MLFDNWSEKLLPLLEKYKGRKHPLDYKNIYQLLIMVILSAQDSDANINKISVPFFEIFPTINSLSKANLEEIIILINTVKNYQNKANWIKETAAILKIEENIPKNLNDLIQLKGVGRKSANVILRESNQRAEGIIVDLHVIRVVSRIGITPSYKEGNKIEKKLIQELPYEIWNDIGMAFSFLGRELCRPTNPKCDLCPICQYCNYFNSNP